MPNSRTKSDLIVHSEAPYNAEPRLDRLRARYITPVRDFYVRCHGNIPSLDEKTHRLRVGGRVKTPLNLSMRDIGALGPRRTLRAVMQCAGNRRSDMQQVRPVAGDPWAPGAIGNAEWGGVALSDLLRQAGADESAELHVAFGACDDCEVEGERFRYAASISMSKAMSPEVLLAFEMNGEPLPAEHGYPLRIVVPGYAGVRSPKWLTTITVQDRPNDGHIQAREYKLFPPDVSKETAVWDNGMTIYDMPLNSAICEPASYAELKAGPAQVRGYAIATARQIERVDVSADGGRNWKQAELEHDPEAPWSWVFWRLTIDVPEGEHELAVRAWDCAGQTQPALPDDVWNFKGYLNCAWHRVRVKAS